MENYLIGLAQAGDTGRRDIVWGYAAMAIAHHCLDIMMSEKDDDPGEFIRQQLLAVIAFLFTVENMDDYLFKKGGNGDGAEQLN